MIPSSFSLLKDVLQNTLCAESQGIPMVLRRSYEKRDLRWVMYTRSEIGPVKESYEIEKQKNLPFAQAN
jgi:hypothetical protein